MAEPELVGTILGRLFQQMVRENDMRRVEAKLYSCGGMRTETVTGVFHQWGFSTTETNEGGIGTDTVAIIEQDDGQIVTAYPNNVRFLDATHGAI